MNLDHMNACYDIEIKIPLKSEFKRLLLDRSYE